MILPLNRHGVRAFAGHFVEEQQELLKGVEERPAGEQTDALVRIEGDQRSVALSLSLATASRVQFLELFRRQLLRRHSLVERHSRTVHLVAERSHIKQQGMSRKLIFITMSHFQ